ncbi:hypothetical protein JIR23_21445 [Bradyrhizobium diazoefficiens]|nr:hypothetical protein [Bradyrhizobium diazoefficiens]QQN62161.1 hypothetical protein JIR23_21445 [Bradyrhizobium diazoefficiens]
MAKPSWLAKYQSGDTTQAHAMNIAKINDYIKAAKQTGGFPADPSRPNKIDWKAVSEESGVKLVSLNRRRSRCRKLILDANAAGIPTRVRIKPRVRPEYSLAEAINIAVAVVQANCELARESHRPRCKKVDDLLRTIARGCPKGLLDDSIEAISTALHQQIYAEEDVTILVEIKNILVRATRGELELYTFHGRLKLESALAGFSLSAVAKVTKAAFQTVINWASGLKAPTLSFKSEIAKIERALQLPEGYLTSVHLSKRSGPSNVKQFYLPEEIKALSPAKQKRFRRLFPADLNLGQLSEQTLQQLMAEKLVLFHAEADSIDQKRSALRSKEMRYGLKKLPPHLQQEFDELVAARTNVKGYDNVKIKKRGWDPNTIVIYERRFCLFFGWMHHELGVAMENLSIAYLGFSQILHEYDLFLLARKEDVGLERRWAGATKERYVFASSLTRRKLGTISEAKDCGGDAGWLRGQRALLERVAPIIRPRVADQIEVENGERNTVRSILTAAEISQARRNWAQRLDDTTAQYRNLRLRMQDETTPPDSIRRVLPMLCFENPLRAIEHGVWQLKQKISELKPGSSHWCTAIRESVAVKVLSQVPLRRQTFCGLTYYRDNSGMVYQSDGKWWLKIPAELFKNEKSQAFQNLTRGGFYVVTLEDEWGLYTDLDTYIHAARDGVLDGVKSDAFYVTRHNRGHVSPATFSILFRAFTENCIAENPGRQTGLQGVKPFGSQAMRHLVASAVFNLTDSIAAAAVAIHDSELTTWKHYRKYFLDPERRAKIMRTVLGPEPDSPTWPKFGEILPRISSPPTAPQMAFPHRGRRVG